MYSDPVSQFYDGIVPAYEHYVELSKKKENPRALLLNTAIDVTGKLFHFREELQPLFPSTAFRRADVAMMCPDFDWVGDVFNSTKHKELDRKGRIIKDKSHIDETIVWTYFPYEEVLPPKRFYSTVQIRILITPLPKKGKVRDLLEISTNVINFWSDFLVAKGLTTIHKNFRYDGDDIVPEGLADASSGTFRPKADGILKWSMIARYYEPETKTFERWGFSKNGELLMVKIAENAPNAKIVGYATPDTSQN